MVFGAARRHLHSYVNMLIEAGKDRHQPVDREAIQIGAADAGEIGGGNAGDLPCPAPCQLAVVEHGDNFCRENGAQLLKVGIAAAKIAFAIIKNFFLCSMQASVQRLARHSSRFPSL